MRRFTRDLNKTKNPNLVIAIIQLRNGLRVSEAVRAYKHFLKHKSLEFEIEVSKRKKPEKRLVVLPLSEIWIKHSFATLCIHNISSQRRRLAIDSRQDN